MVYPPAGAGHSVSTGWRRRRVLPLTSLSPSWVSQGMESPAGQASPSQLTSSRQLLTDMTEAHLPHDSRPPGADNRN